jgi:hypothetical protein
VLVVLIGVIMFILVFNFNDKDGQIRMILSNLFKLHRVVSKVDHAINLSLGAVLHQPNRCQ